MADKLFAALAEEADNPNKDTRGHTFTGIMDAAIPGESLTKAPGSRPSERPALYNDPEEAVDYIFSRMMQRRTAAELLAFMEAGVPVDMLAHSIIMGGLGEGKFPVTVVHLLAGPVTIQLIAMAEAAKISWRQSGDKELEGQIPEIIQRLAANKVRTGPADSAIFKLDKLQRGGMPEEANGLAFPLKRV